MAVCLSLCPGPGGTGELAVKVPCQGSLWVRVLPPRMTPKEVSKDLSRKSQTMMLS